MTYLYHRACFAAMTEAVAFCCPPCRLLISWPALHRLSPPGHVDISFDRLATLARYGATSGEVAFAIDRCPSISAAYHYCILQIDRRDALPHLPAGKGASNEQHRPADGLSLSAPYWIAAAAGFADLAKVTDKRGARSGTPSFAPAAGRLTFAPHLPPEWNAVSVHNFRLRHSTQSLDLAQTSNSVNPDVESSGTAALLVFNPQIPLVATSL